MKISFSPVRLYSSVKFGNQNVKREQPHSIAQIDYDYSVKSGYLEELKNDMLVSNKFYNKQSKMLKRQRERQIAALIGEDYDDNNDDFLEKLSY